jgi:FKBP-type peptidyl-prolyl cis-trans isomerase
MTLPDLKSTEWKDAPSGGGLKIWDVKTGEGTPVTGSRARVKVHYTGWLLNGKVFDSSVTRGEPIAFGLDGVIKGWTNGVPGMKPGGVRRLYIPSALAYGSQNVGGGLIPPNSDLVFEIELLEIQ